MRIESVLTIKAYARKRQMNKNRATTIVQSAKICSLVCWQ